MCSQLIHLHWFGSQILRLWYYLQRRNFTPRCLQEIQTEVEAENWSSIPTSNSSVNGAREMSEPETTEEQSKWFSLRREKWTTKTEISTKNGQTHSCSFFPLEAQNQSVSYAQTVAIIKSVNVKRHYETKHKVFDPTYPLKSEVRSQ